MCSDVLEASFVSLPVYFLALNFLVWLSFFLFFMFYRLSFLSFPCRASSVQTVAKPPNIQYAQQ